MRGTLCHDVFCPVRSPNNLKALLFPDLLNLGSKKPININKFSRLSREWVEVKFAYVLAFPFEKGKHINKFPWKSQENARTVPGQCQANPRTVPWKFWLLGAKKSTQTFFAQSFSFRGSIGTKNPCFFGGFPCLFPKKQGKEGQGTGFLANGGCVPSQNRGLWRKWRQWRVYILFTKTRGLLLRLLNRGQKINANVFLYKVFRRPFGSWTSAPKIVDVRTKKCVFLRPRWWGETFWPRVVRAQGSGMSAGNPDQKVYVYAVFSSLNYVFSCLFGALRKGPPFHGSQSSREIKLQNASCQMGGRESTWR